MTTTHVPAWRRLGLELVNGSVNGSVPEHDDAPLPKKRKTEKTHPISPAIISNVNIEASDERRVTSKSTNATQKETKKRERKKSVSFAIDTSQSNAIITNEPQSESLDEKPNEKQTERQTENQSERQSEEQSEKQSERQSEKQMNEERGLGREAKRQRKQEAREIRRRKERESNAKIEKLIEEATEDKTPPSKAYLNYLYLYHTDRQQWKFNKSTQSSLLKDCFNLYRVPPEYGPALLQYISGLQGHAARARLADDSKRTINEVEKLVTDGFASLKAMDPMNLTEEFVYTPPPPGLSPEKTKEWEEFMEWQKGVYEEWNAKEAAIAADPERAMIEYSRRNDFIGYMKRQKMLEDESRKDTIEYKFEMLKKRRAEEVLDAVKVMMDAMVTEEREKKQKALVDSGKPPKPQNDPLAPKIVNKPKKSRGRKRRTAAADEPSSEDSSSSESDKE